MRLKMVMSLSSFKIDVGTCKSCNNVAKSYFFLFYSKYYLSLWLLQEITMERKIIIIPNIAEEVRIGYSFNYLIKVIAETEVAEAVQWDFKDVHFLHPFFLAPLAIYKKTL